ncbi:uncharacterized protein LOC144156328 isoform X2 [Haemaphysalis longicornis]
MASMRARLLLLVAYVASVAVVVRIDRYWNASGYRLSELLRSGSTEAGAALLVFAAVGLVFSAAVVAAGLSNLATRAFFSRPSCGGSCNCQQQRRQKSRHESQNNVDVSVHPTDTTIAGLSIAAIDQPDKPFNQSGAQVFHTKLKSCCFATNPHESVSAYCSQRFLFVDAAVGFTRRRYLHHQNLVAYCSQAIVTTYTFTSG